jgi:hypothetical protein
MMTTFLLLMGLMQAPQGKPAPDPVQRGGQWGTVENTYFRATKDDIVCGSPTPPSCKDRVVLALGNIELKSGGKVRRMKRGEFQVFGAGQSYERPTGEHFWEITIKADHPPVPGPPEVVVPRGSDAIYEGEDFWIYNEKLVPGELRERHSHTYRAVVQLNAGVGEGGGAALEWPTKNTVRPPDYNSIKLTEAQKLAILRNPPRSNDSISLSSPVIHTNTASPFSPLDGIVVMMKSADEKAKKVRPAFDKVVPYKR